MKLPAWLLELTYRAGFKLRLPILSPREFASAEPSETVQGAADDAKGTAGTKSPGRYDSGRDYGCEDRNGRDRRKAERADWQDPLREGWGEGARGKADAGRAGGDREKSSGGALAMTPYKAKSISNAFISLANSDDMDIDPLKLQKLLYFAHGYYMAEHDDAPLINEYFEAWDYGPVLPTVYYDFREFGDRPIKRFAYTYDYKLGRAIPAPLPNDDPLAEEVIKWVWDNYKQYTGLQLSEMTHKDGGPWHLARGRSANSKMRNERLEILDIKRHFAELTA